MDGCQRRRRPAGASRCRRNGVGAEGDAGSFVLFEEASTSAAGDQARRCARRFDVDVGELLSSISPTAFQILGRVPDVQGHERRLGVSGEDPSRAARISLKPRKVLAVERPVRDDAKLLVALVETTMGRRMLRDRRRASRPANRAGRTHPTSDQTRSSSTCPELARGPPSRRQTQALSRCQPHGAGSFRLSDFIRLPARYPVSLAGRTPVRSSTRTTSETRGRDP